MVDQPTDDCLSIRFAAPPLGDLRWRAPTAPANSQNGTVNATTFGPQCPQAPPAPSRGVLSPSSSEDCLFLNVYAPNVDDGSKLPVLVWIHGGGYGAGNGRQDMSAIINANNNSFVAVAIQYRVSKNGRKLTMYTYASLAGRVWISFLCRCGREWSSQCGYP